MSPLLSPLALLLPAFLVILFGAWRRSRGLLLAGGSAGLLALFAMTPQFANAVLGAIEQRAVPAHGECDHLDAIVLLAGGVERPPFSPQDFAALTPESLSRVFGLLHGPDDRRELPLVISGGGPFRVPEAAVMASLLHRLDGERPLALVETKSTTTWESARQVRRVLPPPRRIALASSALHLPRARRAFLAAGFDVCRWPLHSRHLEASGTGAWWPQSSALRKTEAALHELVGDHYYRWLGEREDDSSSE